MKKIRMRRTSMGRLGHYLEGKVYHVADEVADLLETADACEVLEAPRPAPPAPEPEVAEPEVETADAEPEAETADAPKPRRRRRSR